MGLEGLKLRHLKMLVAMAEHRKVSAVAELFNISQPALSRTLAELEKMTGYQLFERNSRGLSLTPQGEIVVQHARMMVADIRRTEIELAASTAGARGHCSFGTIMTPASDYVSPALNRILKDHPNIDINVTVGSSDTLLDGVGRRELDFALCRIPHGVNPVLFHYVELGGETLRLVVGNHHDLASRAVVTEEDLGGRNWVLQPQGSFLRQVVDQFNRRHAIVPGSVVSTSSTLLTLLMLRESDRIGIFARSVAELFHEHGLLHAVRVDADLSIPSFGLITLADRELSPTARLVYDAFLTVAQ